MDIIYEKLLGILLTSVEKHLLPCDASKHLAAAHPFTVVIFRD